MKARGNAKPEPVQEFFSIGDVCELTELKPHVLRYWESQFKFLSPAKNRSGNRVYQRREIEMVMLVKHLLYAEKYTIEGARRTLLDERREESPQVELGFDHAERQMLLATTGIGDEQASTVLSAAELSAAQRLVRRVPVGESVVEAILKLVRNARPGADGDANAQIAWGPGPRASQALMLACRARALLDGRFAPSIDDVVALAPPILRHRMALTFAARAEGVEIGHVIDRLLAPLR